MKNYLFTFLLGLSLGGFGKQFYYTNLAKPKYVVGDCLDNGLYAEKVIEHRFNNVFNEPFYVTEQWIAGKLVGIDTIPQWQADVRYNKIDARNCL